MRDIIDRFYNWLTTGSVMPWLLIVLAYIWAWPVGIFLTLMKCEIIDPRKWFSSGSGATRSQASGAGNAELRKEKYKVVSHGMSSVSIDYPDLFVRSLHRYAQRDGGAVAHRSYRQEVVPVSLSAGNSEFEKFAGCLACR